MPSVAFKIIAGMAAAGEGEPVPSEHLQINGVVAVGVNPVEALHFIGAKPRGGGGAGLYDQRRSGILDHVPRRADIASVEMTGEQDMYSGIGDGEQRILVPPPPLGHPFLFPTRPG